MNAPPTRTPRCARISGCSDACSATRCRNRRDASGYALIEDIRQTAVRLRRDHDPRAKEALAATLGGLDPETVISVVRAFSFFSQLANIAEDLHHNRRRRAHEIAGSAPQDGSVARALERLRQARVAPTRVAAFFARAVIAPVLTAHPTEVQRKSILDGQLEVARLLAEHDRPGQDPVGRRASSRSRCGAKYSGCGRRAYCAGPASR